MVNNASHTADEPPPTYAHKLRSLPERPNIDLSDKGVHCSCVGGLLLGPTEHFRKKAQDLLGRFQKLLQILQKTICLSRSFCLYPVYLTFITFIMICTNAILYNIVSKGRSSQNIVNSGSKSYNLIAVPFCSMYTIFHCCEVEQRPHRPKIGHKL